MLPAPAAGVFGADGLGRILDDLQTVDPGQFQERVHVGGLTVQVNRHQDLHDISGLSVNQPVVLPAAPGRKKVRDGSRGEIVSCWIDVAEDGLRAKPCDGAAGREEGEGRSDHRVARADPQGHQGDQQRVSARGDADAVTALAVFGDVSLQFLDAGTKYEALSSAHLAHRLHHFRFDSAELRFQIEQWNLLRLLKRWHWR